MDALHLAARNVSASGCKTHHLYHPSGLQFWRRASPVPLSASPGRQATLPPPSNEAILSAGSDVVWMPKLFQPDVSVCERTRCACG
jgi:hypothetical protein